MARTEVIMYDGGDHEPVHLVAGKADTEERWSNESDDGSDTNSIVKTEILQPNQKGIARLFSCLATNAQFTGDFVKAIGQQVKADARAPVDCSFQMNDMKGHMSASTPRVSNTIPRRAGVQLRRDASSTSISVYSSVSGKSSCTGSVSLAGAPYEVLVPAYTSLGLVVSSSQIGPRVLRVKDESPLRQMVTEGDYILSIDGMDVRDMTARELSGWLSQSEDMATERTIILMANENVFENYKGDNSNKV